MKLIYAIMILSPLIVPPAYGQQALTCRNWNSSTPSEKQLVIYGYAMAAANMNRLVEFAEKQRKPIPRPPELFPGGSFDSVISQVDPYCTRQPDLRLDAAFLVLIKASDRAK